MCFYARHDDDGPAVKRRWVTVCRECDWVDDESHADRADCSYAECPKCGSEDVEDEAV